MSNEERQSTVFLSYAHADKTRAQRISSALEKAGYTVWWDQLIEGGSQFATVDVVGWLIVAAIELLEHPTRFLRRGHEPRQQRARGDNEAGVSVCLALRR